MPSSCQMSAALLFWLRSVGLLHAQPVREAALLRRSRSHLLSSHIDVFLSQFFSLNDRFSTVFCTVIINTVFSVVYDEDYISTLIVCLLPLVIFVKQ